ncbi:MAG: type II toxin-antitoxin system RelE/ParE family toxin [Methanobacterium sp.]|jgi:mRNA interferase RelE/StbE|nr:type II toxin-antitoxin system RelE/ParE family toxin [Methanobacterium sp.]
MNRIIKLKDGFLPDLDIKKLKGYSNHYRLRIGKYRVLFQLQKDHVIIIYAILPRKKAYK